MKIYQILDLQKGLPVFMVIPEAKIHDIKAAREISMPISRDGILVMDWGHIGFDDSGSLIMTGFLSLSMPGAIWITRLLDSILLTT